MAYQSLWIHYTHWLWLLLILLLREVIRLTREDIRKLLKLADGLNPDHEDGNMTDTYYNTAINEAIRIIAIDCNLIPVLRAFPLQSDVFQYPLEEDVDIIRRVWYVDSQNQRIPLDYMSPEQWMDYNDIDDTATEPDRYCYPMFMNEVMQYYVQAPPVYDYSPMSYITEQTVRTLVDSGANFGKTLNNRKTEPGFIAHNLSDGSYGYVDVLDITTNKTTGTCSSGTTTNKLEDTGKNFEDLGIAVGDIICNPSTGTVTSYGFVTAVTAAQLTYSDMQGTKKRFALNDTYKVGRATEVRLSLAVPHPGLRNGTANYFKVTDSGASISGVTFANTRATGTITGTPTTAMVAIASGGSHGKITAVASTYVDVDMWIGGQPSDGETVTIKTCDKYQIEDNSSTVRAMWIGPTPSTSDAVGTSSIEILYNKVPEFPQDDTDKLQIPDHYKQLVLDCARWQVAFLSGRHELRSINDFRMMYKAALPEYAKDVNRPPYGKSLSMWSNRNAGRRDRKYTTRSGNRWNVSGYE